MRLSSKILVAVILLVSLAFMVHQFFLIQILANNFVQLENDELASKIDRVKKSVDNQLGFLERHTRDWARWDDTLDFISGRGNGYIDSNISFDTFADLDIDCFLYTDTSGEAKLTGCTNLENSRIEQPSPGMLADMLEVSRNLVASGDSVLTGLASLDGIDHRISVQRISDTQNNTPSNATLMFTQPMGENFVQQLRELTAIDLELLDVEETMMESSSWIDYSDKQTAFAHFTLDDINNRPVAIAQIIQPRKIQAINKEIRLLNFILTTLVGFGLAVGGMILSRIMFTNRITNLRDHVMAVASSGKLSSNIRDTARDEIAELTNSYAELLEKVASSQHELEQARKRSDQANEAKSEFLANMSHEIRTPMTAIMGYTELIREGKLDEAETRRYLDIVMQNSELLLALINDILDLSKIESGKLSVKTIEVNLPDLINDVIALMSVNIGTKPVVLTQTYNTPIPRTVFTDPLRLRQILINLIGNAIKFTPKGNIEVVLSATTGTHSTLRIEIRDTGVGIDSRDLEKIFENFERASTTENSSDGTGLGLPIALKLARQLGGKIIVTSTPGEGSRFVLEVSAGNLENTPVLDTPPPLNEPLAPESETGNPETSSFDAHVLLVDDNEVNRIYISKLLKSFGLQVTEAPDGEQALQCLQESPGIGLVFMDMEMPVMDGYAATEAIRSNGSDIPVVALTANIMAQDKEHCLQAGCSDFLGKPVKKVDLWQICEKYLA